MLGRSPTLTGRSSIWDTVVGYIDRRPWLGYGYGAFWRNEAVEARTIWGTFHWTAPHAHNAWLEIGLALGIVEMAGITLLWLAAFYRAGRALPRALPRARHAVFCSALLVAMLVVSLTEYEFFRPDTFLWVLFTVAFVHLGRAPLAYPGPRTTP